ncbi:conserved exported hypothetical protein [Hyella patelloides LEGE 07179]|uniref:Lipoprotein n=1 Tax=Hyella patelloides LEGE 07179 TaxID=945734 RepID=A0A563W568_9CYAN|nr:hypothetical protein [Hyella patelloides]VEP18841.1 conserved exported hypothetical protein [Hyella patelloides LEGE 07179]
MLKFYKALAAISLLLLFFSCGKSDRSTTSVTAQSDFIVSGSDYSSKNQEANILPYDPAIKNFLIPPEIAVMQATINAGGNSFNEVAALIDTNTNKVIQSISSTEGCSANIVDYQHPRKTYGKRVLSDSATYYSNLQIEIIISFAEMNNVQQRIEQINNCWQAISTSKLEAQEKDSTISLTLSDVIPTIENVDRYRKQLLETKFDTLKEVANLSETPSQFNASDTKCTSKGDVKVVKRSLSNIELDVDFNCLQFNR